MKITIDTTPEQDIILADLNKKSNPDGKTDLNIFSVSLLSDYIDSFQVQKKTADVAEQIATIQSIATQLSDTDLIALKAITSKY